MLTTANKIKKTKAGPPAFHSKSTVCTLIALLILWPSATGAQGSARNDRESALTSARDFLKASYPEIFGRGLYLNFSTSQAIDHDWRQLASIYFAVTSFTPAVQDRFWDPTTGKPAPADATILTGLVWFNREGRLHQFWAGDCDFVHYKENHAIRKLVESHPEWSEARAFAALREAGAHYGPSNKVEFLKKIQLGKYERFLGHFKVKSVEFGGLADPHEGSFASLYWSVNLEVESLGGANPSCTFVFELFDGRLTHVIHGLVGTMEESTPGPARQE